MAVDPDPAKVIGLVTREHDYTRRPMQIRVLGPLEASIDDQPVAIGGAKQRAVLAMLGLEANRAVTADRLIEGLWGDEPPASAAKMVQNYVWRLRSVLADDGGAEIVTRGRAYELRIDRELVDVCRLERLVSEASRAAAAGRAGERGARGAGAVPRRSARGRRRRAVRRRRRSAGSRSCGSPPPELAIDADLAAGRHHELVGEIDALLAENPLRERLHAQRMLALYRCGRQAEALEAYRHARATLVEEIGVEPSAELRRLHEAILRQDPALDVEAAAAELPRELDATASPPLIGRDDELRRLRARWRRAAAGAGALVTLVGAYGMGKTRLAAELAGEAHREGAMVLYAAGTGAPEAALAVARARARERGGGRWSWSTTPTARPPRCAPRCASSCRRSAALPVLVLATGLQAAALARLEPQESVVLEPLDADSVRAIAGFYAPGDGGDAIPVETLLADQRRRRPPRPRGGERVGAARGDPPRRRRRRSHGGRPQRGARARGRAGRQRRRAAVGARARRPRRPRRRRRRRRRWSARTRASRRSTPTTPSTSSGASGSSPSWSRASSARRCSRSSARRAAASRRSCGPGCCPRSPAACCRAARTGPRR